MANPKISMIAAMSQNRVIGKNNSLPWRIPADTRRFKELTSGHVVIMGRKTYESMGKPLPDRQNIILTHSTEYHSTDQYLVAHTPSEAIELAQVHEQTEIFIIGGAKIYQQYLSLADYIYLTVIHQDFEGDTFFPHFEDQFPQITFQEPHLDYLPPFTYFNYSK